VSGLLLSRCTHSQLPEDRLQALHLMQEGHRIEHGILLAQSPFALLTDLLGLQGALIRRLGLVIFLLDLAPHALFEDQLDAGLEEIGIEPRDLVGGAQRLIG